MNCTKCNNPVPDGAKFCPSCGASFMEAQAVAPSVVPAPESEKKYFCEKCGLELARGVKFCSVCGGSAYAKDVSPIDNGGNTFGEGNMSAVSLDKPSQADDLVSAMNAAAAPASSPVMPVENIPAQNAFAPVQNVPMPSDNVPVPSGSVPAPSESGFNSGFTTPAPAFAPSADAADASGGFGPLPASGTMPAYGGAAAAVKPIKKKHKGRVALIVIIAVVALLGAAAVLFFTNRAAVLSTLMGKAKYAAMVEGTHIKQVTEKIDMPAVANGIKSATGIYQAVSSNMGSINPNTLLGMTNNIYGGSAVSKRMSDISPAPGYGSMGNNMEMDLSAMEKMYAEMLQSAYGKNSVNGTVKANVEIGDSLKSLLGNTDLDEINEVLKYVNGTTLTYNVSANENALAYSLGTEGKITVNAKVLMNGQDMYISLPFVSDKAIKITFDKPVESSAETLELKPLELDAAELERIVGDIVKIYLEHYKNLEIEMENGEISAAGVTVTGKLITAEFSEKDLLDLFNEIAEYLAKDEYLSGKIVEFANSCGVEIDENDYYDALVNIFEDIEADDSSKNKVIINTVINRNGDVLGKSFEVVINKQKFSVSYAELKEQVGMELKASSVKISLLNEKTDNENGSYTFKVTAGGSSVSLVMKYSDVKEVEFCGNKTVTGNFELSMKLPNSFEQMLDKDSFAAINGAKITLSLTSDSPNTMETSIGVKAPGYLDVSLTETVTALDDTSGLNAPSNAIDLTPLTKGGYLDDAAANDLAEFAKDLIKKLESMGIETGIDPDDLDQFDTSLLTGKVSKDAVDELIESIDDLVETLDTYIDIYGENSDEVAGFIAAKAKFEALKNEIRAKNYNITQEEYSDFGDKYYEIYFDMYR